jgi:hypothetical protein
MHGAPRRPFARVLVIATLTLVAMDVAWATWSAFEGLRSAKAAIEAGTDALERGDLRLAATALADAEGAAGHAESFGAHPTMMVAGALPFIGDDVHAVETIARATRQAAGGGEALAAGLAVTGWSGDGLPGVEAGGRIDPGVMRSATPGLTAAASALNEAVATASTVDVDDLLSPLGDVIAAARRSLVRQASMVTAARDLSVLLPSMLGDREPRDYLLAFQNLSAPRGTGGFFGFYGTLHAEGGVVTLDALRPASDVPQVPPVDVPPEVSRRYGPFGVTTTLYASNYSPDIPTSSRVALEILEAAGSERFDGVVWVDTVWMAEVLRAVGAVESAGWSEPLTSDNLVDVLNRQSFLLADPIESNRAQAQIGIDVWRALLDRAPDPRAFASAMATSVETGHFAVYAETPQERSLLDRLGVGGAFELGENPLAVIWQDASASRAGYFADKPVTSTVSIDPDGTATVATEVTLRNEAPGSPPSILLGDGKGTPVGSWGADVEVYLPATAENIRIKTSDPSVIDVDTAFDHPVADCYVYADADEAMSCTVSYRAPGAVTEIDGELEYRVEIRPQPALRPQEVALEIAIPEGAEVLAMVDGATEEGGVVRWSGAPAAPTSVWVRWTP